MGDLPNLTTTQPASYSRKVSGIRIAGTDSLKVKKKLALQTLSY
jgi:hypothetical protein